jgi:hypothetical protein
MLAPSTYTWPPWRCTISQIFVMPDSNDHERGEAPRMLRRLLLQVAEIDVAGLVAGNDDHAHARHLRGRGIRAVRRAGNEADIAVPLAAARVPRADDEQSRVLALRAGVGLYRNGRVPRGKRQAFFQVLDQLAIAEPLLRRCERVDVRELPPRHRDHLGGRVQLHRARPQRDHRTVERHVLVGEAAQVAQHLRLGVVAVEHRVREEGAFPCGRCRNRVGHVPVEIGNLHRGVGAENGEDRVDVRARRGLIERDSQASAAHVAEVHPRHAAALDDAGELSLRVHRDRVEEVALRHPESELLEPQLRKRREPVNASRDARESLRAVIDRIHGGHDRQQHLCGADIGSRLLAPDVLLARLQREAIGGLALGVHRHAHQAPGHAALQLVPRGHVARMRAAETHGHAEAL